MLSSQLSCALGSSSILHIFSIAFHSRCSHMSISYSVSLSLNIINQLGFALLCFVVCLCCYIICILCTLSQIQFVALRNCLHVLCCLFVCFFTCHILLLNCNTFLLFLLCCCYQFVLVSFSLYSFIQARRCMIFFVYF